MVIQELRAIQERLGYLPEKELQALSARLAVPVYELYGVASFYPHFRLKPPPRCEIRVCSDLPCHMRLAGPIYQRVMDIVNERKVQDVEVKATSCLGQCDGAPALLINDEPYAGLSGKEILALLYDAVEGTALEPCAFPRLRGPFRTDPYASADQHYAMARALIASRDAEAALLQLTNANLVGMGGAGFPTGKKWGMVRQANADAKYVICNADESEVGTFKDREIIKNLPHCVVEGLLLAGLITGAQRGIIYIRHEYEEQIHILEEEIARARASGLIGQNLLGSEINFEMEIFISPGGYIQGEESALLEALEGRRGQPRVKPPYPVTCGLYNKPTAINNVETLAYVPAILARGADWFKSQGVHRCSGLKWVAVSGHVNNPGVFEVPMGTLASDVIYRLAGGVKGGRKLKAWAPSGPSSGFLPGDAERFPTAAEWHALQEKIEISTGVKPRTPVDIPLDFKTLQAAGSMLGSGAIIAIAEGSCMLDLALNETRFYRNESCGKCVPCRVGSQKMVDILYGITHGTATNSDLEALERLSETLVMTSICGLGQVVPNPILSAMKYFGEEVHEHVASRRCPSGVCFERGKAS